LFHNLFLWVTISVKIKLWANCSFRTYIFFVKCNNKSARNFKRWSIFFFEIWKIIL